jgi:chromosome segregation ATPase
VSTQGNSQQRSQNGELDTGPDHSQSPKQSDPASEQLRSQLEESEQKINEITVQKEYLSGTCESQADYIRELTAKIQTLQTDVAEKQNALEFQRKNKEQPEQAAEQLHQLTGQLDDTKQAWQKDLDEAHTLQNRLISRLTEQTAASEKTAAQLKEYWGLIEQLKQEKESDQQRIKTLEQTLEQAVKQMDKQIERSAIISNLKQELAVKENQLTEQAEKAGQSDQEVNRLQNEMAATQNQLDATAATGVTLQAEIEQLQERLETKTSDLESVGTERQQLIQQQQDLQERILPAASSKTAEPTARL